MISIPASFKAFLFGCVCTLALGWLSSAHTLHWINLKVHDQALNLSFSPTPAPATLLIHNDLQLDDAAQFGQQLNGLLTELNQHKVKNVVLLTRSKWVVQSLQHVTSEAFIATPFKVDNAKLKPVKLLELAAIDGIYRQFYASNDFISLYNNDFPPASKNAQYFNYFLDISTFPNLSLSQAIDGSTIQSLVADKVVLIDLDDRDANTPFYIPESSFIHFASLAELQAIGAQTLLNNSTILMLNGPTTILLLLIIYTLYFFSLQLLSIRGTFVYLLIMIAGTYGLAMAFLIFIHTLLPTFELIAVQVGCVIYLLSIERLREENLILKISADLNARLSKKVQPPSFYQSENPWDNLHTLINQQLNLHRSIFLSKIPKDHRVEAIHALNCSIEDIKEMRRDFQRAPYSVAIATQKPILLTKQYFNAIDENELEYMAPLTFSGNVLGFWALTVVPDNDWNQSVFENNLVHFSREITELLFHRKRFISQEAKEKKLFRRFMSLKMAEAEYSALDTAVSLLEKRFNSLQYVFDGMTTASALYNLFGQIIHSNKHMEAIVQQWQLPLYTLTAHDFLLKVTSLDSNQIKQRLLQVTLHKAEVSVKISHQAVEVDYILRIRSIDVANDNKEQGVAFLLLGLLFELIDVSEAQRVISMKKDLYSQYFHQMRNNLSTLNLISRQLNKHLPPEKQRFVTMLEDALGECTKVNVVIEDHLALQRSLSSSVMPINPFSQLQSVVDGLKETMLKKRIVLALNSPTIMSLVMAEPAQLSGLLLLICNILIDDSDSNESTLTVNVKDTQLQGIERVIVMSFVNEGYGIPQENLDRLLQIPPTELGDGKEMLEQLLLLAHNSLYWGATVTIASTLGSGYTIDLSIPVFLID
jgi:signal transduction histidine kinase/CHASE2 domain-containing sensor protein